MGFDFDRVRTQARRLPASVGWFDLADDLGRTGVAILSSLKVPLADTQKFCLATLFVRVHDTFQSAILLLEHGMIPSARDLLRSATEGAIASFAVKSDAAFIDELIGAHRKHQLTLAEVLNKDAAYKRTLSSEQIAEINRVVSENKQLEVQQGSKFRPINWADVAVRHCPALYDLLYRDLSTDGTHVSVNALNRYVQADANLQITALKGGPDISELPEALSLACLVFLWALHPVAEMFELDDVTMKISDGLRRFRELSNGTPSTDSAREA